jgi:hypothetical protein
MTMLGGLGRTLPHLIPSFQTGTTMVIFIELWAIAWIQTSAWKRSSGVRRFRWCWGSLVLDAGMLIGGA